MFTVFKTSIAGNSSSPASESLMACADDIDVKTEEDNEVTSENEILQRWKNEQDHLKSKVIETDTEEWQKSRRVGDEGLSRLGGVDVSFVKNDNTNACASVVVLELPSLKTLYSKCRMIKLTAPYISGFLGFREVPHIVKMIEEIPEALKPQVILVDGNGKLHYRCFGSACHLGVFVDLPTIGVAKNLLKVDGIKTDDIIAKFTAACSKKGDCVDIIGQSGTVFGKVYQSTKTAGKHPIYVSLGHRISLETTIWVVNQCCTYRIPEPIRQADLLSRDYLRTEFYKDTLRDQAEQITEAMKDMTVND